MKVVILAGGFGTRLSEETLLKPKPMVEIGGRPIMWHIMNGYSHFGHNDFVIACGYKQELIKEYFHNYYLRNSDFIANLADGSIQVRNSTNPDWRVGVVDTGIETMTGGRILRLREWLGDETFMVTYGDGVADVDVGELVAFHKQHGRLATVTAVHPPARFGALQLDGDTVAEFSEKPISSLDWINGGFFVFEPQVFDYLPGDDTPLERGPLDAIAAAGQLMAYKHSGFWQPMDTLRDKLHLETLWADGTAPWKVWKEPHEPLDVLPPQEGADHRPHRIQGNVAQRVA